MIYIDPIESGSGTREKEFVIYIDHIESGSGTGEQEFVIYIDPIGVGLVIIISYILLYNHC